MLTKIFDAVEILSLSLSLSHCHTSPELAKSCVLPELTELTNDEEPAVREAALESIANVVSHLPVETVRTVAVPLVVKIFQKSLTDVSSPDLTGVARLLGKLSHQLKGK